MVQNRFRTMTICVACVVWSINGSAPGQATLTLQNERMGLSFDQGTGALVAIENKLAGEQYAVSGDEFALEAVEFSRGFSQFKPGTVTLIGDTFRASYESDLVHVDVVWTLDRQHVFAEKRMTVTCTHACGMKNLILSRPTFAAQGLRIVPYRYPKFGRQRGEEPVCTFFGRTSKGGLFAGVEVPFDSSTAEGQEVVLRYAPSLKILEGEKLDCEPVYFGVYRRGPHDDEKPELPLPSESDAMVTMVSAILGPPRFGLVPMACGWHSEMVQGTYNEQSVADDMRSLDFLAECGIDWLSDSHPWGGETEKMNALGPDDKYEPGPLVEQFLEHARKTGVKVVMWSSMNKTHAWSEQGRPFRADQPDWLLDAGSSPPPSAPEWRRNVRGVLSAGGNCLAHRPFYNWLVPIHLQGMAAGRYLSWAMDGDFFGGGGWYTTVVPVDCQSDKHDHLAGDSNYACQRALEQLTDAVRKHFPETYIFMCRPPMDLGVWSLENVDVCFTLLEEGTGTNNLAAGDHVRTWSRMRVHRDFFPHYLDQPLLFPSRAGGTGTPGNWPSGHLEYILLSALSSSPNQLYYLPTKTGIPAADRAEIRHWLDWGRQHVEFLKVRKDLPDWPAPGRVDGSAHLVDDRGLIFLFNSGQTPLSGEFVLTEEGVGLQRGGDFFQITQEHPVSDRTQVAASGDTVRWEVPAETAVVLNLQPVEER
ncbi:MAG: hypothetical protein ACYC6N_12735 [Pirellulaceae bacterium]